MNEITVETTWDGLPVQPDERVRVRAGVDADGHLALQVDATWFGDPAPDAPVGSTEGLWNHEVVEVFVAGSDGTYTEIELGPFGHHLVLRLGPVRVRRASGLDLVFMASRAAGRWQGRAIVDLRHLPPRPWRWAVFAVHGQPRRYLAWPPLPGPAPDFHQPERFVPWSDAGAAVAGHQPPR